MSVQPCSGCGHPFNQKQLGRCPSCGTWLEKPKATADATIAIGCFVPLIILVGGAILSSLGVI